MLFQNSVHRSVPRKERVFVNYDTDSVQEPGIQDEGSSDSVTVARARVPLAKQIGSNGNIEGYAKAKLFDFTTCAVNSIDDIGDLLNSLLPKSDTAVLRGEIIDRNRSRAVRRLLHMDQETGEHPTLREAPRRWLALDIENIPIPSDLLPTDIAGCGRHALSNLPAQFSEAACIVQASGSHGLKPDMRLRLWFWCDRPVAGLELKRWLRGTPADLSVFGAAQLIYTAAPIFCPPTADPITTRLVTLPGTSELSVPIILQAAPLQQSSPNAAKLYPINISQHVKLALQNAAESIISAPLRHPVIVSECCKLAAFVAAGLLPETTLRNVIMKAAEAAGKDDIIEIESCIKWALQHPRVGVISEQSNV